MSDEPEIKVEVLSTHELIQAAHRKNVTDHFEEVERKAYKEFPPQKLPDIEAIKLMLQALMDKVKGLDAFVRQNSKSFGTIYESMKNDGNANERTPAAPTIDNEANLRKSKK